MKYKNLPGLSQALGLFLGQHLQQNFGNLLNTTAIITFVPLYPARQLLRGYNQSELVAKETGRYLKIETQPTLIRTRDTRDQTKLTKDERLANVRHAFEIIPGTDVTGKNIFIIDDVSTTGATLKECAKVLKRNKASGVFGVTLAQD